MAICVSGVKMVVGFGIRIGLLRGGSGSALAFPRELESALARWKGDFLFKSEG